jgi:hypothetical protein
MLGSRASMGRWDKETVRDKPKPTVLSVGSSHQLNARCHTAAAGSGAQVREAPDVGTATTYARESSPLAIVVPASVAKAQADAIAALVEVADCELVVASRDDIDAAELEELIHQAVVKTARRRGETTGKK